MVGVLVISHGPLAKAMISSAEILVGKLPRVKGISIWPKENPRGVEERIRSRMREVQDGDGVMILTDLLGGTPTNLSLSFSEKEKTEVITGVNMPMLLTLASHRRETSLEKISRLVRRAGRSSIKMAHKITGWNRVRPGRPQGAPDAQRIAAGMTRHGIPQVATAE